MYFRNRNQQPLLKPRMQTRGADSVMEQVVAKKELRVLAPVLVWGKLLVCP